MSHLEILNTWCLRAENLRSSSHLHFTVYFNCLSHWSGNVCRPFNWKELKNKTKQQQKGLKSVNKSERKAEQRKVFQSSLEHRLKCMKTATSALFGFTLLRACCCYSVRRIEGTTLRKSLRRLEGLGLDHSNDRPDYAICPSSLGRSTDCSCWTWEKGKKSIRSGIL